jgi:hypothetical protein
MAHDHLLIERGGAVAGAVPAATPCESGETREGRRALPENPAPAFMGR